MKNNIKEKQAKVKRQNFTASENFGEKFNFKISNQGYFNPPLTPKLL